MTKVGQQSVGLEFGLASAPNGVMFRVASTATAITCVSDFKVNLRRKRRMFHDGDMAQNSGVSLNERMKKKASHTPWMPYFDSTSGT